MVEDEAAAALHLPLKDLEPVPDVERMVLGLVVAAARRHEDRVGIVERRGIGGPAVEVGLDARALEGRRVLDAVTQEDDVALVLVGVLGMRVERTGDQDDLLCALLGGRRRAKE